MDAYIVIPLVDVFPETCEYHDHVILGMGLNPLASQIYVDVFPKHSISLDGFWVLYLLGF